MNTGWQLKPPLLTHQNAPTNTPKIPSRGEKIPCQQPPALRRTLPSPCFSAFLERRAISEFTRLVRHRSPRPASTADIQAQYRQRILRILGPEDAIPILYSALMIAGDHLRQCHRRESIGWSPGGSRLFCCRQKYTASQQGSPLGFQRGSILPLSYSL